MFLSQLHSIQIGISIVNNTYEQTDKEIGQEPLEDKETECEAWWSKLNSTTEPPSHHPIVLLADNFLALGHD